MPLDAHSFNIDRRVLSTEALAKKYAGCIFKSQNIPFDAYSRLVGYHRNGDYLILEYDHDGIRYNGHGGAHRFQELEGAQEALVGWKNPYARGELRFFYSSPSRTTFIKNGREPTAKEKAQFEFLSEIKTRPNLYIVEKYAGKLVVYKTNKYSNLKGRKFPVRLVATKGPTQFVVKFVDSPHLSSLRLRDLGCVDLKNPQSQETGYWVADTTEIVGIRQ